MGKKIVIGQCDCECHKPGVKIMHFMPCCDPVIVDVEELSKRTELAINDTPTGTTRELLTDLNIMLHLIIKEK